MAGRLLKTSLQPAHLNVITVVSSTAAASTHLAAVLVSGALCQELLWDTKPPIHERQARNRDRHWSLIIFELGDLWLDRCVRTAIAKSPPEFASGQAQFMTNPAELVAGHCAALRSNSSHSSDIWSYASRAPAMPLLANMSSTVASGSSRLASLIASIIWFLLISVSLLRSGDITYIVIGTR